MHLFGPGGIGVLRPNLREWATFGTLNTMVSVFIIMTLWPNGQGDCLLSSRLWVRSPPGLVSFFIFILFMLVSIMLVSVS